MLQQTTVETVIPYYQKFIGRFPDIPTLAEAPTEEVLRYWSGLGYYSRARNLQKAAQDILQKYKGILPQDPEELLQLPGIGKYTAGAIASIAFDQRAPILDGNVMRVLSRIFLIKKDPKSPQGQKIFWPLAEKILPKKNCGDFNEALMELGATLCRPTQPLCPLCPLKKNCLAFEKGKVALYPFGKKKTHYEQKQLAAAVIEKNGQLLLVQRPKTGLLKSFWEFPMVEGDLHQLLQKWPIKIGRPLASIQHSVLNKRLRIESYLCQLMKGKTWPSKSRWIPIDEVLHLPTSSMNHKILAAFLKNSPRIF